MLYIVNLKKAGKSVISSCLRCTRVRYFQLHVTFCTIWFHLYSLKIVKNTNGGVLHLVKLQTEAWNFTENTTLPWVFFTSFKKRLK